MSNSYQNPAVQFQYPDGWELDETRTRDGFTLNLQSPYSMFLFLTFYNKPLVAEGLADEALRTMAEEYAELDSGPVSQTIASRPAVGHDVNFFSLDLTNTCWIRALTSAGHAVLIFAQTSDLDLERGELAFRGICGSLKLGSA